VHAFSGTFGLTVSVRHNIFLSNNLKNEHIGTERELTAVCSERQFTCIGVIRVNSGVNEQF